MKCKEAKDGGGEGGGLWVTLDAEKLTLHNECGNRVL